MRRAAKIVLAAALTAASFSPAFAKIPFGAGPLISPRDYPGAPKRVYQDDVKQPYAMNYADEAVQSLGFKNGHMDLFSTKPAPQNPYMPSFSGGLGGDGAMLKLQWHPGE
jgi:hypothetical protein